jgi:hypothetical protein
MLCQCLSEKAACDMKYYRFQHWTAKKLILFIFSMIFNLFRCNLLFIRLNLTLKIIYPSTPILKLFQSTRCFHPTMVSSSFKWLAKCVVIFWIILALIISACSKLKSEIFLLWKSIPIFYSIQFILQCMDGRCKFSPFCPNIKLFLYLLNDCFSSRNVLFLFSKVSSVNWDK